MIVLLLVLLLLSILIYVCIKYDILNKDYNRISDELDNTKKKLSNVSTELFCLKYPDDVIEE